MVQKNQAKGKSETKKKSEARNPRSETVFINTQSPYLFSADALFLKQPFVQIAFYKLIVVEVWISPTNTVDFGQLTRRNLKIWIEALCVCH